MENKVKLSLQKFRNNIINTRTKLNSYADKYIFGFKSLLLRVAEELKNSENIIKINNPERQLKLGYSISTINGKIIRSIKNIKVGQNLEVKVSDGTITSEIKTIDLL